MSQRFEGSLNGFDQTELFFQTWTPETTRGVFLITHGLAEHSECYHALAKVLVDDGWLVYAWDMRGHGRSEGKRGYVRHIDDFVSDLGSVHAMVRAKHPEHHLVLFGHSLGGLVTLRHLQRANAAADAVALSSPALGLSVAVPKLKESLAKIAVKWLPTLTMYNEINMADLSRNEDMIKSYRSDALRHEKISPGLFLSMVEGFPLALAAAAEVKVPVLMQLAGDDRLVSTAASRALFEHLPNRKNQLLVYPESYHEIYNDLDRDQVISDLKKFISPYLGA